MKSTKADTVTIAAIYHELHHWMAAHAGSARMALIDKLSPSRALMSSIAARGSSND